ncbi:MAG: heme lyase CcmF/NrfE family subunit [Xanthomonadales bacterium]|nr:heme lyase CcmF/NrfE family subunit [Xanthomonadales bacterium]
MIGELGQIALIGALFASLLLGTLPLIGAHRGQAALMAIAPRAVAAQFVLVALAFGLLTAAFVQQDFSVEYVARNSNSLLPLHYRFSAVWGAHEGSLLLWQLVLAGWTLAVAAFSGALPESFRARVLAVLGLISVGFGLFVLLTSNPFGRILPAPPEGMDLNPLLQDPGLIIHPPMLYMGYVGFSVAFAFAVAALLDGRLQRDWVRWSRPWTLVAWAFLTVGIALGSWWAYYELGWGGWWFWDPVENASFMPWLVGTALIHSQAVTEKRGALQNWTLLLALAAFSLSLLGTFLVRSGVLTSVHAFASDPTRGVFILAFLVIVVGGSLALFAARAPGMSRGESFAATSKETMLLVNNLLLTVMAATILLGTLYPLLIDALGLGKISVGPPYFSMMFIWLLAPLVLALPLGMMAYWRRDRMARMVRSVAPSAVPALLAGVAVALWMPGAGWLGALGIAAAAWVTAGTVGYLVARSRSGGAAKNRSEWAMVLAHLGLATFLVGASLVSTISTEEHLRMAPGDRFEASGYEFEFLGVRERPGPNWVADEGQFQVYRDGEAIAELYPQKRRYVRGGQVMTEAAIDPGLTRDVYLSLGEPLDAGGAWSVRVYVKPFVRWIWLGALMMMFAGLLGASDPRLRRRRVTEPQSGQTAAEPAS